MWSFSNISIQKVSENEKAKVESTRFSTKFKFTRSIHACKKIAEYPHSYTHTHMQIWRCIIFLIDFFINVYSGKRHTCLASTSRSEVKTHTTRQKHHIDIRLHHECAQRKCFSRQVLRRREKIEKKKKKNENKTKKGDQKKKRKWDTTRAPKSESRGDRRREHFYLQYLHDFSPFFFQLFDGSRINLFTQHLQLHFRSSLIFFFAFSCFNLFAEEIINLTKGSQEIKIWNNV